ncbi:MAG: HAD-IA family hydrolase [Planctomycetes bacterium]|nr:HAD-IA family hydrolase [Planctomycetota bacterium]MBI3845998.1 HAD-IA family hydrolase [Planctomycetota bacterium]
MGPLRAAFFDVGNTLSHVNYPLIASTLRDAGVDVAADRVRTAEIRSRIRMDEFLSGQRSISISMEGAPMFRAFCRLVLEDIGPDALARGETVIDALEAYNRAGNLWDLAEPSVPRVAARLRERGLRLGVISNADGRVAQLLERQGVASLFDAIVDSGQVHVEKPNPAIFLHAAALLGVDASESVHVGDFYSIDLVGSRRAGMQGILLDPLGAWSHVECRKARDLDDAAKIILGP